MDERPDTTLPYATPPPAPVRQTGRAIVRLLVSLLLLPFGTVIFLLALLAAIRFIAPEDVDWFAVMGMTALTMAGLGIILSGATNLMIAILRLRGVPEAENRWLAAWQRVNRLGQR